MFTVFRQTWPELALTPLGHLECHLVTPPYMSSLLDLDLSLTLALLSLQGVKGEERFGTKLTLLRKFPSLRHPLRALRVPPYR
jgi:hypothetical protein